MEYTINRMRTIKDTIVLIREQDPNTAITYNCIKNLCIDNKIKYIKTGNKYLVNLESVFNYFNTLEGC